MEKVVIALGGNAILKKGEKETYSTLTKNVRNTFKSLIPLLKNNKIIVTFGNGPEIGFLAIQNEMAKSKVPEMPLNVLGAESQGLIGYIIEEQLLTQFRLNNIKRSVATIITQVLVNKKDNAFKNPSKFIGPFYNKKQAELLKKKDFIIKEDIGRGYRRVVPSPKPLIIIESDVIRDLLSKNIIVIAAGGGGIPVSYENNKLKGVEAVIDKDLASACLANGIKADTFIMITDVDKVYLNFKRKNQKELNKVKLNEIKRYYKEGHFPAGNMGPKIEAAINFLSNKGKKVIITDIKSIEKAINGKAGTIIEK